MKKLGCSLFFLTSENVLVIYIFGSEEIIKQKQSRILALMIPLTKLEKQKEAQKTFKQENIHPIQFSAFSG